MISSLHVVLAGARSVLDSEAVCVDIAAQAMVWDVDVLLSNRTSAISAFL